jgi:hypothetical protein
VKVIIAGSRHLQDYNAMIEAMDLARLIAGIEPTMILHGAEPTGADMLGERWAVANGVPFERYSADWVRFPKTGGFIRNCHMARRADALVAVMWEGGTPGTHHMIKQMVGKPTYVLEVPAPASMTGTQKSRP